MPNLLHLVQNGVSFQPRDSHDPGMTRLFKSQTVDGFQE